MFFSPFSIAITWFGEKRANLSAFCSFALVWFRLFTLLLGVWERLRLVIVAIPGLFSYLHLDEETCIALVAYTSKPRLAPVFSD